MTNETGICNDCQHKETCKFHKKYPWEKVTDCGQFLMNETLKKIYDAILGGGEHNA